MLAGLLYPSGGSARVLGYVPWERDDGYRRQFALLLGQKNQLWWDLPANESLELNAQIYGIPRATLNRRVGEMSELLSVRDKLNVSVRELSLGERMKMELIAALLHSPRVVYLDEPTLGLDLTAQRAIRDFILKYREAHRPAMILTSHYMEDIERLCKRILIIREGELVFDGSLEQVVQKYADHKVVTVHLRKQPEPVKETDELRAMGKVETCNDLMIKLRVGRTRVAEVAGELLRRYPVADLAIEEVDVGTIIERIIRARKEADTAEVRG